MSGYSAESSPLAQVHPAISPRCRGRRHREMRSGNRGSGRRPAPDLRRTLTGRRPLDRRAAQQSGRLSRHRSCRPSGVSNLGSVESAALPSPQTTSRKIASRASALSLVGAINSTFWGARTGRRRSLATRPWRLAAPHGWWRAAADMPTYRREGFVGHLGGQGPARNGTNRARGARVQERDPRQLPRSSPGDAQRQFWAR